MAPALPFIALGLTAVGTGVSVYEAMNASTPSVPTATDTSAQDAATAQEAARAQATELSKRRGLAATMLTGSQGILSQPNTAKATLGT